VKQWQAREESRELSRVTIRGLLSRACGGWWMGGVPPTGYDLRHENGRGEFLCIVRWLSDGSKQVMDEVKALEIMKTPKFSITLDLKTGKRSSFVITSDITYDYLKINAHYRT